MNRRAIFIAIGKLLLLSVQLTSTEDLNGADDFRKLLEEQSGIFAHVVTVDNSAVSREQVSYEFHSRHQQRSRVEIHKVGSLGSLHQRRDHSYHSVYYIDGGTDQIVRHKPQEAEFDRKCTQVTSDDLVDDLLMQTLLKTNIRGDNWLGGRYNIPKYVLGMSRLLLIVNIRLSSIRHNYDPEISTSNGIRVCKYELTTSLEDFSADTKKVTVYHPDGFTQVEPTFQIPIRIIVLFDDGSQLIVLFRLYDRSIDRVELDNSLLDFFAFPVGLSCSRKMTNQNNWLPNDEKVIASFNAEIFNYKGGLLHSRSKKFIAFDGFSFAMRVDSLDTSDDYSITITDFRDLRKYNILLDASMGSISLRSQCVSTKIAYELSNYPLRVQVGKLFLMGSAVIRGVNCLVFEGITNRLPPVLFPHLTYRNQDGQEETMLQEDGQQQYNIVYYFADDGQPTKRSLYKLTSGSHLMQVDIYIDSQMQYHVEIEDFLFQLVDAPNGDNALELFSLKDRCANGGSLGTEAYAELDMKLTLDQDDQHPDLAKEISSILESSGVRNKAILRALSVGSIGFSTKIHDLQSNIISSDHDLGLSIQVKCRLSMPYIEASLAKLIGFAKSVEKTNTSMKLAEECFFQAAHQQIGSRPALVLIGPRECDLDLNPNLMTKESDVNYSSEYFSIVPMKDSNEYKPVFVIEKREDFNTAPKLLWRFRGMFNYLNNLLIRLPLPYAGESYIQDKSIVRIEHLEMTNDRWSATKNQEKASADSSNKINAKVMVGIGLTSSSGSHQISEGEFSCRTLCMYSIRCRSFSICLTDRGIECVTSEIDFRDSSLLESIENEVEKKRYSRERVIYIPIGSDEKNRIELKLDLRCKLYKKNPLEMFHKLPASYVDPKNITMRPVDSIEKCAELCLGHNMIFLRKLDKMSTKYSEDKEAGNLINDYHESNLASWCSTFRYLNLKTSSSFHDYQLDNFVDPSLLDKVGLCILTRPQSVEPKSSSTRQLAADDTRFMRHDGHSTIKFGTYRIIYASFYKPHYGIRLKVVENKTTNNVLMRSGINVEECAEACFLQTISPLKPYCKSFDFIEVEPGVLRSYCVYHTTSLDEIGAKEKGDIELIEHPEYSSRMRSWHYEPRFQLMAAAIPNRSEYHQKTVSQAPSSSISAGVILLTAFACATMVSLTLNVLIKNKLGLLRKDPSLIT